MSESINHLQPNCCKKNNNLKIKLIHTEKPLLFVVQRCNDLALLGTTLIDGAKVDKILW